MSNNTTTESGWDDSMPLSLHQKLKIDLKQAMLAKDDDAKNTIRQIMSEYQKIPLPITLESGKKTPRPKNPDEITNDDILNIIMGLVKSEKTVLELKKETSSPYLEILESYLPRMAAKEEIIQWIQENIDLSAFKSPMQAMKPIMQHFGKKADGNMVKDILQGMAG